MDSNLRRAWTAIVTAEDYDEHMACIGQAQAAADLTRHIIETAGTPSGGRVVIAGAGTGQVFDFLDAAVFRPFQITCTDLSRRFLDRLVQRLSKHGLSATVLEDDIEDSRVESGPDLLLATLLLEHIDWRRGVEAIARLGAAACGIIIQENPHGMTSAVTPGRPIPPSIAEAVKTAHPTLVPFAELATTFAELGYRCGDSCAREVADGKRLIAVLFVRGTDA